MSYQTMKSKVTVVLISAVLSSLSQTIVNTWDVQHHFKSGLAQLYCCQVNMKIYHHREGVGMGAIRLNYWTSMYVHVILMKACYRFVFMNLE